MTPSPELFAKSIVAGAKAISALAPMVKKVLAGRKAAKMGVPMDPVNDELDEVLLTLFGNHKGNPNWKTILRKPKIWIVSPNHFQKPAVQEWANIYGVEDSLKELALDECFGVESDDQLFEYLIGTYSKTTGENEQHAKSVVTTALAVLRTSLLLSKGNAVILEALAPIHKQFDSVLDGLGGISETIRIRFNEQKEVSASLLAGQCASLDNDAKTIAHLVSLSEKVDALAEAGGNGCDDKLNEYIDRIGKQIGKTPSVALTLFEELKEDSWGDASDFIKFRILANIGGCHYVSGDTAVAADYYLEAEKYAPENGGALRKACLGYLLKDDFKNARIKVLAAIEVDPEEAQNYSLLVFSYSDDKTLDKVEELVPERFKDNAECLFAISSIYQRRNELETAIEWVKKAVDNNPDSANFQSSYSSLVFEKILNNRTALAGRQLTTDERKTLRDIQSRLKKVWEDHVHTDLAKLHIPAACNLANIHRILEEHEEVESIVKDMLKIAPSDVHVLRIAGLNALDLNNYSKALGYHEQIDDNPESELICIEILARQESYIDALKRIKNFDKALLDDFKHSVANRLEIMLTYYVDGIKAAESFGLSLLKSTGDEVFTLLGISKSFYLDGDTEEAVEYAQRAYKLCLRDKEYERTVETAYALHSLDAFAEAGDLFEIVIASHEDSDILRCYLACLLNAGMRGKLENLLASLHPNVFEIAYYNKIAAYHYWNTGQPQKAIKHLGRFFEISGEDLGLRLLWLSALSRVGDDKTIFDYLKFCPDFAGESPYNRMALAQLLNHYGFHKKSIEVAYKARREAPRDEQVHALYVGLFLFGEFPSNLMRADKITEDTFFMIKSTDNEERSYIVETDTPLLEGEYPPGNAVVENLLGKKVGDEVEIEINPYSNEVWTVTKILPKPLHLHLKTLNDFNVLFPDSNVLWGFKLPEGDGAKGLSPIYNSVDAIHAHTESIFKIYKENLLPIPVVASLLGRSPIKTWYGITSSEHVIRACHGTPNERQAALDLLDAHKNDGVVVDPFALLTIHTLDVANEIKNCFKKFFIPQTTIDLFRQHLEELKEKKITGSLGRSDDGYVFYEFTEEELKYHITFFSGLLDWVQKGCIIVPAIPASDPQSDHDLNTIPESMGGAFIDTIYVASGKNKLLLSDELGYRMFADSLLGVKGVWLQIALMIAKRDGYLSADKYVDCVVGLARLSIYWTSSNATIFNRIADRANKNSIGDFTILAKTLSAGGADDMSAASIANNVALYIWRHVNQDRGQLTNILLDSVLKGRSQVHSHILLSLMLTGLEIEDTEIRKQYWINLQSWCTGHFISLEKVFDLGRELGIFK